MKSTALFLIIAFVTTFAMPTQAQNYQPRRPAVTFAPPALLVTAPANVERRDINVVFASLSPLNGTDVTYVENDTNFYLFDLLTTSKAGPTKKMVIMSFGGRVPEVGLPPHTKAYYHFCPCGEENGICLPAMPGMDESNECVAHVFFKAANWRRTVVGTYMPTGYASTGCKARVMDPRTTDPQDNALVVSDDRLGRACAY